MLPGNVIWSLADERFRENWIPVSFALVFLFGMGVQRYLLRPMFMGEAERLDEYATIITITLMVLFRNLAIIIGGPYQYSVPDYFPPTEIGPLPISGNRFMALVGTVLILAVFYFVMKKTWAGLRPMTPDSLPVLGTARHHNLYFNTGHGHMGWTMVCSTASLTADLVAGRTPELPVDHLRLR